jgi:hypothetical protein
MGVFSEFVRETFDQFADKLSGPETNFGLSEEPDHNNDA